MTDNRADRSPEAVTKRRKASGMARAANRRAGYVHDPIHEALVERYVEGEITSEEAIAMTVARFKKKKIESG